MSRINRNAAAEARGVPETDQLGGTVDRENSLTTEPVQGHRGARSRAKGDRIERDRLATCCNRDKGRTLPLSGGTRLRGSSLALDIIMGSAGP
jgi:hypothetical protein